MEEDDLTKVKEFLREKGFFSTQHALLEEQVRLSTTFQAEVHLSRSVDDPSRLQEGYSMLRKWVYGCLQQYKHELLRVLYPVFVQCFVELVKGGHKAEARIFIRSFFEDHELMHSRDLHEMSRILASHTEEMDLSQSLRAPKFKVELSEYSYELLFRFLHKEKLLLILEAIIESIIFEVSAGQPSVDPGRFFPLDRGTVAEMLKTGSASALVGISALNVVASKLGDCPNAGIFSASILPSLPYAYLPFGLFTVALGVGATKNYGLLGWASVFFLVQFVCIFIVGGIRVIACGDEMILRLMGLPFIITWISYCCFAFLFMWGCISEYPKCLHHCVHDLFLVKIAKLVYRRRAVQSDLSSELDLEAGQGNGDQASLLASSRSKNQ